MGAFNVAVVIPKGGNPSVEHPVALAMEPHRGEWVWYAIGGYPCPDVAACIIGDGRWLEPPEDDWESEYLGASDEVVIVRCKG